MKQDSLYAKVAFFLSLGFWIPLFNIAISIISAYFAVIAIQKIMRDPKKYGGLKYAVIALVLSASSLIMTVIGMVLYVHSGRYCEVFYSATPS
ncbi:MAG: hypothetical protein ABH879_09460 [archaeon]